ncbi:MAG TPA: hypothetical protein VMU67_10950 [Steroidobacteraceae bacterium]|nr:hypothetical protein [Steroidobacteraceae bacterium]
MSVRLPGFAVAVLLGMPALAANSPVAVQPSGREPSGSQHLHAVHGAGRSAQHGAVGKERRPKGATLSDCTRVVLHIGVLSRATCNVA